MKKFILAIVQTTMRFVVRMLMLVTPTRIQIHVFSRLIDACLANKKFNQALFRYNFEKILHQLNPDDEKPEAPVFVKLYNAFVFAHDTLSAATPPSPEQKATDLPEDPHALIQDLNSTRGLGFACFNLFAIF